MVELSYLAGVLHGDGWCTDLSLGLKVADHDFATEFSRCIKVVFNKEIKVSNTEGYWRVRANNKSGRYNNVKNYSPVNESEITAWVKGLFDSEGNAQFSKLNRGERSYNRRISFYSTEYSTLKRAKNYMEEFNITSKINTVTSSKTHLGDKQVYELLLQSSKENFSLFNVHIGSSIQRKRKAIEEMLNYCDVAEFTRAAQKKGAERKNIDRETIVLPAVVGKIKQLASAGAIPKQRDCYSIDGYHRLRCYYKHSEILNLALNG